MTPALMIQGTGSDVGKSLIVAGLARAFTARGMRVRPFKPQNMSNNAAVAADGGEIGRAQALQARACKAAPSVHMNPVLLKPETDTGAQVIVCGKRQETLAARDFAKRRGALLPEILKSFDRLCREADLVLVEGAGSPAEINLRENDIANMGFAQAAGVPVALIGDIHRGGVIASIVGTFEVVSREDADRIACFIVNNFHGDTALFDDGVRAIEDRIARPCAGVVPHFPDAAKLPAEDAMALDRATRGTQDNDFLITVPRLSRIANFDDLDPLRQTPGVAVEIVQPGTPIPAHASLVLLPGTKSTIGDLCYLREQGWDIDIKAAARQGAAILGLCGGYQMLGKAVHDPQGLEGPPGSAQGLGLLDVETTLQGDKTLSNVKGVFAETGVAIEGYEIHLGHTTGPDCERPFATIDGRADGACSPDGNVRGTYLHGIFACDAFRTAFLEKAGVTRQEGGSYDAGIDATLNGLAAHLEEHANLDLLLEIASRRGAAKARKAV